MYNFVKLHAADFARSEAIFENGEEVDDLVKVSQTRQTLMTKYNVKNPGHLVYLGVGDRDW
ncbi:MAG TPA: hypothetical protein IGS53_19235 [Leptolyngbyaceae cyanobacterium M33_DOE_097]|uniref:Uncharacterized protein n=1 Tax=Oscillatoriales cyanobacterium SpSt-418 TaxID=2282169 RepID=A0A7C3PIB2_9CYAN|nr:hypothetical protein [Leptolyngbyaceae cyanobacterium M33_DOE_097]